MKLFILLPLALFSLSFADHQYIADKKTPSVETDSTIVIHKQDGTVDEWPADKFSDDKETGILYAMDNDNQNLYLALKIPSQGEQMKLMRMGMNLYIDLKGKHKSNRGVEFPVKKESGGFQGMQQNGDQRNNQEGKPDFTKMRMMFALNLISMKIFGFTEEESREQDLEIDNNIKIAFNWDSTNLMQIEYLVPLKMLENDIASLNQKTISVGWKVNGIEIPGSSGSPGGFGGGRPGVSGGGARPGSGSRPGQADMDKMMKEQELWTKYTFTITKELKGF